MTIVQAITLETYLLRWRTWRRTWSFQSQRHIYRRGEFRRTWWPWYDWATRTRRPTLRGEHSQEKISLTMRDHPRHIKVWFSRWDFQRKQEISTILQLCSTIVWHHWCRSVGARTLTVPNFGNSAVFVEVVSGVTTQNSLRGVGVESKPSFCNNHGLSPKFRVRGAHGLSPWFCNSALYK